MNACECRWSCTTGRAAIDRSTFFDRIWLGISPISEVCHSMFSDGDSRLSWARAIGMTTVDNDALHEMRSLRWPPAPSDRAHSLTCNAAWYTRSTSRNSTCASAVGTRRLLMRSNRR
ncbi:hypothetical protein D3C81_1595000 [compost metagenome]